MLIEKLSGILGEEVSDPDEEHFLLFSTPIPSSNLGFLSSTSATLSVSVGSEDLSIHQSPGLLSSNAASGTTGAVLWKITPLVAEWLLEPDNILLGRGGLLQRLDDNAGGDGGSGAGILELGCGIAGVIALALRKRVARYVATDLDYVLRGLRRNLVGNGAWDEDDIGGGSSAARRNPRGNKGKAVRPGKKNAGKHGTMAEALVDGVVEAVELDWTECTPDMLRARIGDAKSINCILACDCIYNESLVDPFVQTCIDVSSLRSEAPICLVAQQLRSDLVLEAWLKLFHQKFHTWRVRDELLSPSLREGSGYVVHIGLLRGEGE